MLHPFTVIAILAFISLPAFGLFCWIMFDDIRNSTGSIFAGIAKVLLMLVSLRLFAFFLQQDDDNSMLNVGVALVSYVMLIVGEYYLLTKIWPTLFSTTLQDAVFG